MVTVARPINGISLNGVEDLLDEEGERAVFKDKEEAVEFLRDAGVSEDEIDSFLYLEVGE